MTPKKLWLALAAVIIGSFAVLGFYGVEIFREMPPFPNKVVTEKGETLFEGQDIKDGQNVWQSVGGQTVGSVWGHGAYVAPDWTADYLHRESELMLNALAKKDGKEYSKLSEADKAKYKVLLQEELRKNTYNPNTGIITYSEMRAQVARELRNYYAKVFLNAPEMAKLRAAYAMRDKSIEAVDGLTAEQRLDKMDAFFAWSSWVCVTNRPGSDVSYTNNWPHDPVIGNTAPTSLHLWSGFSVLLLLFCVGILVYYYTQHKEEHISKVPESDPMRELKPTASMRAVLKYIWVVGALMLVQMLSGVITAHYGVEGDAFFGLPIQNIFPYAVSRSWHVQLAILWIATSWLATGLYIAPAVSGVEPKYQALGVNVLFGALVFVVAGSLAGQWFGVMQKLGLVENFWLGHQGYEYIDLGRVWQIILFVGLVIWMLLLLRGFAGGFKNKGDKNLLAIFAMSAVAVGLFYGAGLFYGQRSPLPVMEYWRWWVVHLWVEGFFEVFATASLAFVFVSLGLVSKRFATFSTLASASLFMIGGIPGTFHHLYFAGTTTPIMAIGASFSALEVVPLVLLGAEAYEHYKLQFAQSWAKTLKWPLYCFIAVAFWNMLGAGVFGFLINPPISLFYIKGAKYNASSRTRGTIWCLWIFGTWLCLACGYLSI